MNFKKEISKKIKEKKAIGQFNFCTMDQLKAVINACAVTRKPVILGTSQREAVFFGVREAGCLVSFYRKKWGLPVYLNLDHGKDFDLIKEAVDSGYDMVHFDGSDLDIKENIKRTKETVKYARKKGVIVEGEIGRIPGKSTVHTIKFIEDSEKIDLNDIDLFSRETSVDLLAVPFGNFHGVYSNKPKLDFSLIENTAKKIKSGLVLHGGSGIPDKDIEKAIKSGIVKININTELRLLWKKGIEKSIKTKETAPYLILDDSLKKVNIKVKEKINLFDNK